MTTHTYVRHWSPWSIALVALVVLAWAWINRHHLRDEVRDKARDTTDWWKWKRMTRK